MKIGKVFSSVIVAGLAVTFGLAIALGLAAMLGESPALVFKILVDGSIGSQTSIGYSLFYATPLIFTGLSVSWALRAGLFNIGAEGQMTIGGIAMAVVGIIAADVGPWLAWPLSLFAGFSAGYFWGWLIGWLKTKKGVHEVLSSILLNFVSYGLAGFFILDVFRNPDSANPETIEMGSAFRFPLLEFMGGTSPLNLAFFFALVTAAIVALVIGKSKYGLYLRWVGAAPEFARRSGVSVEVFSARAMAISGGLAGLAGASVILGYMHKAREGFSAGAGFIGIAVALLGRGNAWGVVAAAILFGCLQKGSLDLDIDSEKISRDLASVIQALIVVAVAVRALVDTSLRDWWLRRTRKRSEVEHS